ncbi:hypothetical protein [Escherichia coli]|uniref:hypothetical protein n=1 Tax=Escherichia coli TaxID=562 RepID=UPI00050AD3ED|nr:hypothetical protein [Escherichia coli]
MITPSINDHVSYLQGAIAALEKAKEAALIHAGYAGLLAGPDVEKTLRKSFGAVLDPLIKSHSSELVFLGFDPAAEAEPESHTVCAVVTRVFSRRCISKGCWRVDFEAHDLWTDEVVRHSLNYPTVKAARKCKPGKPMTWKTTPPPFDFDDGAPF